MAKIYGTAEVVETIAGGLIPNYHPHLANARIMYVFADKASKKGGREVSGTVKKLSGFTEWALETDFVIEIAADHWQTMSDLQKTALVDHLLERCFGEEDEKTGEMKWSVRDTDVQEFVSILDRYGAWNESLQDFVRVAQDLTIENNEEIDTAEQVVDTTSLN